MENSKKKNMWIVQELDKFNSQIVLSFREVNSVGVTVAFWAHLTNLLAIYSQAVTNAYKASGSVFPCDAGDRVAPSGTKATPHCGKERQTQHKGGQSSQNLKSV